MDLRKYFSRKRALDVDDDESVIESSTFVESSSGAAAQSSSSVAAESSGATIKDSSGIFFWKFRH